MKKYKLLIVLTVLVKIVVSQDYQCVKTGAEYFFTNDYYFQAIRIDSVVSQNDNQVYYNFPVMGETIDPWCLTENGPSWIGRKMIATPAGENIFFNLENDAITIKTQATTGQYWNCYGFPSGNLIRATVESIGYESFLELSDTVKTISFQATDPQGNPISHTINEMNLKLSKSHGLIKTVNFRAFPDLDEYWHNDYCQQYDLCGISEPAMGVQNLTPAEVFNFDVGDEFHSQNYDYNWVYGSYVSDERIILIVTNKQPIGEEWIYTLKRCGRKEIVMEIPDYLWDTVYYFNDTITRNYFLEYSDVNSLPEQVVATGDSSYSEYHWYNQNLNPETDRMQKVMTDGFVSSWPDTCIYPIITEEKYFENKCFIAGLGGPYWDLNELGFTRFNKLVYYKKGTEEWGTPYNCDSLLVGIPEKVAEMPGVCIAPNPMRDWTRIGINLPSDSQLTFTLTNSTGQPSGVWQFSPPEFFLVRNNLPAGVYFFLITNKAGFTLRGKIVMF